MTFVVKNFCLVICIFFLGSCVSSQKRSYYPQEIFGERIVFYVTKSQVTASTKATKKDFFYSFHNNGTFEVIFNGDLYELGRYSYQLQKNSNQATLITSKSSVGDQSAHKTLMTYKTAYSGIWESTQVESSDKTIIEEGTFRFIR